jgi:hypothetical protein
MFHKRSSDINLIYSGQQLFSYIINKTFPPIFHLCFIAGMNEPPPQGLGWISGNDMALCGQCYKKFYGRKLRLFLISYNVCRWQAFPA